MRIGYVHSAASGTRRCPLWGRSILGELHWGQRDSDTGCRLSVGSATHFGRDCCADLHRLHEVIKFTSSRSVLAAKLWVFANRMYWDSKKGTKKTKISNSVFPVLRKFMLPTDRRLISQSRMTARSEIDFFSEFISLSYNFDDEFLFFL